MKNAHSHLLARRAVAMAAGLMLVSAAVAQQRPSSVRAWGRHAFDTEGRDGHFVDIAANTTMSAVLTDDGRVMVNGTNALAPASVPAIPPGRKYVAFDANLGGGAAIVDDGTIRVWGGQSHPAFPNNVIAMYPPAPALPAGVAYVDLSASGHVLAMRSDGELVAFGASNQFGQLDVPVFPPGVAPERFRVEGSTNWVFLNNGTVAVWGNVSAGQDLFPAAPLGVHYVDVDTGFSHGFGQDFMVALRSDGQVVTWGDTSLGQDLVPPLPAGVVYTDVSAGWGFASAVRSDGVVVHWGATFGTPPALPPGLFATRVECGDFHTIALLSDGTVRTWGENHSLQSQIGNLTEIQGSGTTPLQFTDIAMGYQHCVALTSDGHVSAWGITYDGQSDVPASLQGVVCTKVAACVYHSAALTTAGEAVAWGANGSNQLNIPPLPAGMTYVDLAAAYNATYLIRSDGAVVPVGGLVNPNNPPWNWPPLPPGVQFVDIEANEGFMLLRSDGQVWSGFLAPPALPAGVVFTDIAPSNSMASALRSDGIVVSWGSAGNPPAWRPIPQLPWGVYYVEVAGGYQHVAMRRSDGKVEVAGLVWHILNAVPPLVPGTSYLQVSSSGRTTAARVGAESIYRGLGRGCAGSLPAARLVPQDTPKIGRPLEVILFDLPVDIAVMAMSFQNLRPPVSLASLGAPGCELHVPPAAVALLSGQNQQAKFVLQIPDDPLLLGTRFFHQALVLDPQAGNALGAVLSDAMHGVVGDR